MQGQVSTSSCIEEEVFENERFIPIKGWGSKGNLLPTDRRRFSRTRSGADQSSMDFPNVDLPAGGPCACSC